MIVGVCKVCLHFDEAFSLKDKRMILKSIVTRIKNKFNAAVAEISDQEKYQLSTIGISCISNDSKHIESMLSKICNFIEADARLMVNSIHTELIQID